MFGYVWIKSSYSPNMCALTPSRLLALQLIAIFHSYIYIKLYISNISYIYYIIYIIYYILSIIYYILSVIYYILYII